MTNSYYYVDTFAGTTTITLPTVNTTASNVITVPVITSNGFITWNGNIWCITGGDLTGIYPSATIKQNDNAITVKKKEAGCSCAKCLNFNDMAEPNQKDGSFICWSCRHGY